MDHTALKALEEAHDDAIAAARDRIEQAEQHLHYYRTELNRVGETVYQLAERQGIAYHPDIRTLLRRVSDDIDENSRGGSQAISRLEEDLTAMSARHEAEREEFLGRQR